MKELVEIGLNTIEMKKATYGDIRIVDILLEEISVKNGIVKVLKKSESTGFGVRVIKNGAWGFASSSEISKDNVQKISSIAVDVAEASSKIKKKDIFLGEAPKIVDKYTTKIKIDPFTVSIEEKINFLLKLDEIMRKVKGITIAEAHLRFIKTKKLFASNEGSFIEQEIIESIGGIQATAIKNGETGYRSYDGAKTLGYEYIQELKFESNAQKISEEAVALLTAKEMEETTTTVILDPSMVCIQIHETVGHPTELDRVLGTEASFAGTSHLTTDKLNKFNFASPIVSITQDATIPGGLGSFGYDDEGIPAQKSYLIKDGLFVGYLTSRETAPVIGEKSNGTMRAKDWSNIPLIRMTNINLEPGTWKLKDLIEDTDEGVYLCKFTDPSIDDKRLNYSIGAEIGWKIKNGKLTEMVKRPHYTGISYEIWRNCDAICCKDEWDVIGVPGCGKGEPTQVMHVGHGVSPIRLRNIKVGRRKI